MREWGKGEYQQDGMGWGDTRCTERKVESSNESGQRRVKSNDSSLTDECVQQARRRGQEKENGGNNENKKKET